ASSLRDRFARLAVGGIALYFAAHMFINVGVNLGLIPLTGLPLPLFSTGGSSMITTLAALGLALGSLPALAAELSYGGISNVLRWSAPLVYNPYYWDFTAQMFSWNPTWLIAVNQLASYGMLGALIALAVRSRDPLAFFAPIAFVLFCKLHTNVQFWYFVYLPALLVPIPEAAARFGLIAACPLLDVRSALELVFGPFGDRGYRGMRSVFDLYRPPPR
ncbi:MAG: FtsW/RodA/SpoVE family cell cycle protein, partial [Myxococcota bacterium]